MTRIRIATLATALGALAFVAESASAQGCNEHTWDLWAGQSTDVGSVTVSQDAVNLYVTYTLDYQNPDCPDGAVDAEFGTLHVWVGNDLLMVPANPNGIVVPGQFCQAATGQCFTNSQENDCGTNEPIEHGITSYTFVYAIADLDIANYDFCTDDLFVVTHAEVFYLNCDGNLICAEQDENGCCTDYAEDTAFGGDTPGGGPRWWFYGVFTPDCGCDGNGPGNPMCETAYAKGGWVWTTQPRSNPEDLPSLELTRNRWGWAINLEAPGVTTYDIWAGAGLNRTENGELVGMLLVDWDGAEVEVCYMMFGDATLAEVHIYAEDGSPATIAPGQYGFIDSFEDGVSMYCTTLPLTDPDGDGAWLVAHAVTCTP